MKDRKTALHKNVTIYKKFTDILDDTNLLTSQTTQMYGKQKEKGQKREKGNKKGTINKLLKFTQFYI